MTEALTLARPYARAAFDLAKAQGALDDWSRALAFAAAVAADPRTAAVCNDPRTGIAQAVALHLPEQVDADTSFARFLHELAEHKRLQLLPEVQQLFDAFKRESEAVLKVRVTSAMPIDDAQADKLKASLKRRFSRDIELETAVDPALLAGAVIDTGEQVIDGSARGRLARMASTLAH